MTIHSGMRPIRRRVPASIEDGGTGARTAQEAAAALGVPSLDGDNVFTGQNEFEGTTQIRGALEITLTGSDALNVIDSGAAINVLDFSASNGATYTLPAGGGTVAISGDPVQTAYNAQGSTYTAQITDCVINCTGTWTLTLPTAVGVSGRFYYIKNSGAGTITMAGTGGQTFDGVASPTVAAGASLTVCSDGANWLVL